MSMICKCDGSKLFPRCDRNGEGKCEKEVSEEQGYNSHMATIVDIDDTLLRNGSQPIQRVIDYVNALPGPKYIVTGRPESTRAETVRELKSAGVRYSRLYMNPYSTSNSNKHKAEIADKLKDKVSLAIENNPAQRAIYSRYGIKTKDPATIKASNEASKFWNLV